MKENAANNVAERSSFSTCYWTFTISFPLIIIPIYLYYNTIISTLFSHSIVLYYNVT